jgi:thiamine biosynthesis lipoprotein
MGMTVTIEVVDSQVTDRDINNIFEYFHKIDNRFSTYKESSEISKINSHQLPKANWSDDMKTIFELSEKTKQETNGYFDIYYNNAYDPSGIIKGWAILHAAKMLEEKGFKNFYVDAGGDIQAKGKNNEGNVWTVGIRNPFNVNEVVKVVKLENNAIATSGTYIRGHHIYNPHMPGILKNDIVSLSVIGPDIYEADRFATAAFAMGEKGLHFIENRHGLEGYMINKDGVATYTTHFNNYVKKE